MECGPETIETSVVQRGFFLKVLGLPPTNLDAKERSRNSPGTTAGARRRAVLSTRGQNTFRKRFTIGEYQKAFHTVSKMFSLDVVPPLPKKKKNKPPSAYKPNNYKLFVTERCAQTGTPIVVGYEKFKNEWL
ncbi:hypothetical protein RvY_19565, partial [Ramazzottius varieornatus]